MPEPRGRTVSVAIGTGIVLLLGAVVLVLVAAPDPGRDRVEDLAERLRCPVCTSVSVAESPSETAVAMRQVIVDQVAAGRTDAEIVAHFRVRYGDWAVIDPPASGSTLLLWVLPVVAAVAGAGVVLARTSRRYRSGAAGAGADVPALSDADRARVRSAVDRRRAEGTGQGYEP